MRTEQNLSKYFKIKQHGNTVLSDEVNLAYTLSQEKEKKNKQQQLPNSFHKMGIKPDILTKTLQAKNYGPRLLKHR